MANYVLSPAAARRLVAMMRGHMVSDRVDGPGPGAVDEQGYPHPYELTYAASAGAVDDQTGETAGAWIIWVPPGSLVMDGEEVDLAGALTPARNYPEGWYDLTDIFDGTDPEEFDLYLDASKDDPKFVMMAEDAERPVLIAKVDGKTVKGIVKSALVFTAGGNKKPFDIVTDVEDDEPVKKIVRCIWVAGGNLVACPDFTLPSDRAVSVYAVVTITYGSQPSAQPTIEAVDYGEVPEAPSAEGDEEVSMFFAPLYDIDEDGVVVVDYRDALVTLDWIGVDENTCSYGGDGARLSYMHLAGFYGSSHDLSEAPDNFEVLVRYTPQGMNTPSLFYLKKSDLASAIGGGGGGGGGHGGVNDDVAVGGSGGIFAWTAQSRTIGPGGCMVGRKWYNASGTGSNKPDGLYQLKITLSSSGASCQVVSGVSLGTSPSGDISYIPIYQITNAKIAADYRGAFVVPAYE